MKQIQTLVTREKELRAEVSVDAPTAVVQPLTTDSPLLQALRMRKELLDLAAKFDNTVLPGQLANCSLEQQNGGGVVAPEGGANGGGGGAGSVGGADSSVDGCSTSSGLGGSSSTIASSSSSAQQSARDGLMPGLPGAGGSSEPSSRRSTAGEIDHPLQT